MTRSEILDYLLAQFDFHQDLRNQADETLERFYNRVKLYQDKIAYHTATPLDLNWLWTFFLLKDSEILERYFSMCDGHGNQIAHYAVVLCNTALLSAITERNQSLLSRNSVHDMNIVRYAALLGYVEILDFLYKQQSFKALFITWLPGDSLPIHCAALSGNVRALVWFKDTVFCDFTESNTLGQTIVNYAASSGNPDMFILALRYLGNPDRINFYWEFRCERSLNTLYTALSRPSNLMHVDIPDYSTDPNWIHYGWDTLYQNTQVNLEKHLALNRNIPKHMYHLLILFQGKHTLHCKNKIKANAIERLCDDVILHIGTFLIGVVAITHATKLVREQFYLHRGVRSLWQTIAHPQTSDKTKDKIRKLITAKRHYLQFFSDDMFDQEVAQLFTESNKRSRDARPNGMSI